MAAAPHTIGLTGAIASGKSTALEILGRLGAATISADGIVHELLDAEPLRSRLIDRWGDQILAGAAAGGGEIDRAAVGRIVFADPAELAWLEAQIHPLVGERIAAWLAGAPAAAEFAAAEIPLLFEGELHSAFDTTVAIVAADRLRNSRAEARGHALTPERERLQLPQSEKAERADHVVTNDGTPEQLEAELAALLATLAARARR